MKLFPKNSPLVPGSSPGLVRLPSQLGRSLCFEVLDDL